MPSSPPSPWPDGYEGALSITFDDGVSSQLTTAIPMMNDHGLRGTFYLNPRGDDWEETLAPWREVAAAGHELGNHTMGHVCSRGFTDDHSYCGLEDLTLAHLEEDIAETQRRLQIIDPREHRSFAYPCYQAHVGEGAQRVSYVPVVAKHCIAGRGKGEVPNHPLTCDLHYLWSWPVERSSGPHLVGLAEQSATRGRWGILTMHGIHEGHLSVADVDFRELLVHLRNNAQRIWVAPVAEIAEHIVNWRAAQL
jgi:peptidoglycan/xylan/chitin deacetylase (PgdA/CDA1 family)